MAEIKINSINLCTVWHYSAKNQECMCKRSLHSPTANEIQKKVVSRNNVVSGECGHTFHKECLEQYFKSNVIAGDSTVNLCPIDHLKWNPLSKETLTVRPEYYLY
jgi:hypothetical protein